MNTRAMMLYTAGVNLGTYKVKYPKNSTLQ